MGEKSGVSKSNATYAEIKNNFPDLFEKIKNEGRVEGAAGENNRMKKIDSISQIGPGTESLVYNAKYKTPVTADELAIVILDQQKTAINTLNGFLGKSALP